MNSIISINIKNPVEVRRAGLDALVSALGPIGMAMFLKQYEVGEGNYTKERSENLDRFTEDDIERLILTSREDKNQ